MGRIAYLAGAVCLVAYLALPTVSTVVGRDPAPVRQGDEFAGKVVAVNVRMQAGGQFSILQHASTRRLGGREFLVGEMVAREKADEAKTKGVECWLPMENVESIMVFADKEKAFQYLGSFLDAIQQGGKK